jgi:hypothetical protein
MYNSLQQEAINESSIQASVFKCYCVSSHICESTIRSGSCFCFHSRLHVRARQIGQVVQLNRMNEHGSFPW